MKFGIRVFLAASCLCILTLSVASVLNIAVVSSSAQADADIPPSRNSSPIVYDAESDRIVMFGGWKADFAEPHYDDTWSYDYDSDTWQNMNPTIVPPARAGHSFAYDEESDKVIMFSGGKAGESGTLENWEDTWSYDFNANTWANLSPSVMPPPSLASEMAYDSESDVCVFFGGIPDGGSFHGETWAYDYNSNNWTEMNPPLSPSSRATCMAYDSESDRIILFGGGGYETWPIEIYGDTWAYDYNTDTWTNMNPADHPTFFGDMVYDVAADEMIVFGGALDWDEQNRIAETWSYDYNTNTWTLKSPITYPDARARHAMAYDVESDCTILYTGGWIILPDRTTYHNIDDYWVYDSGANTWDRLYPRMGDGILDPVLLAVLIAGIIIVVIVALFARRRSRS